MPFQNSQIQNKKCLHPLYEGTKILLLISRMLNSERARIQNKPSAIKVVMSMRKNPRSLTEHKQGLSLTKTQCGEEKNLLQLIQKSKDFSSIFTKHKRSEYSGYKQINMNKSKIIKFQNEHREISRYQTPRKYQINLKNIAKLRKRYSLEPTYFRQTSRDYRKYLLETSKERNNLKLEEICSDRKCQKELKYIIQEMNTSKHFSAQKSILESEKQSKYITERQSTRTHDVRLNNDQQEYASLPTHQKMKDLNKNSLKLGILKVKRVKNKFKNDSESKRPFAQLFETDEHQEDLCGWETQTFYLKNKKSFFQSPKQ